MCCKLNKLEPKLILIIRTVSEEVADIKFVISQVNLEYHPLLSVDYFPVAISFSHTSVTRKYLIIRENIKPFESYSWKFKMGMGS